MISQFQYLCSQTKGNEAISDKFTFVSTSYNWQKILKQNLLNFIDGTHNWETLSAWRIVILRFTVAVHHVVTSHNLLSLTSFKFSFGMQNDAIEYIHWQFWNVKVSKF